MARAITGYPQHVAILAGGGDLPLQIAADVVERGGTVHMVAIRNAADARIERYPHTWVNLGQASRMFTALKAPKGESGVMVIAGAVTRPDLTQLRPDFGLVRVLAQVLGLITAGGDDALLTRAIRIFEREGLTVVGVQDVAPDVLIGAGLLGKHPVDVAATADIARGREVLAALGGLDVGQAIVIEDGRVLAIEGVEGTDRMLGRLKALQVSRGRAVLLKAPKPRQERRVDLPTIGLQTIERAHAAGIRGVAVVAGSAIGLQRIDMARAADQLGMFIVGVTAELASPVGESTSHTIHALAGRRAKSRDLADVEKAADTVARLARFGTGAAAVVVRGHVIAVSAAEGPAATVQRAARLRQWGLGRFGGKRGVLAVRLGSLLGPDSPDPTLSEALAVLPDLVHTGLAGLAVIATAGVPEVNADARIADVHGVFLVAVTSGDTTT